MILGEDVADCAKYLRSQDGWDENRHLRYFMIKSSLKILNHKKEIRNHRQPKATQNPERVQNLL